MVKVVEVPEGRDEEEEEEGEEEEEEEEEEEDGHADVDVVEEAVVVVVQSHGSSSMMEIKRVSAARGKIGAEDRQFQSISVACSRTPTTHRMPTFTLIKTR